jgi:predicted membrane protein
MVLCKYAVTVNWVLFICVFSVKFLTTICFQPIPITWSLTFSPLLACVLLILWIVGWSELDNQSKKHSENNVK